jgi:hypothetical protein
MNVVYATHPIQPGTLSLFLAGPTPRAGGPESWRPQAIQLLEELGFDGTVYIPEPVDGDWASSYDDQVGWEYDALHASTLVVFWVPRSELLPGFTTNVEFGYWLCSGKIRYGRPAEAMKNRYLDSMYRLETGLEPHDNLRQLLEDSIYQAGVLFRANTQ